MAPQNQKIEKAKRIFKGIQPILSKEGFKKHIANNDFTGIIIIQLGKKNITIVTAVGEGDLAVASLALIKAAEYCYENEEKKGGYIA